MWCYDKVPAEIETQVLEKWNYSSCISVIFTTGLGGTSSFLYIPNRSAMLRLVSFIFRAKEPYWRPATEELPCMSELLSSERIIEQSEIWIRGYNLVTFFNGKL